MGGDGATHEPTHGARRTVLILEKSQSGHCGHVEFGRLAAPPVKAVPKKSGGVRVLGIPTVSDRIAQTAIKMWLEPQLDPLFHDDSYGYRPGKSALEAIAVTRRRCWDQDWVVEFDIRGLFDNLDHGLLMTALRKHCQEPWILLYVERWLKAPMQSADGQLQVRDKGTPQGGVVSPILANLFLHYAFDLWVTRHLPGVRFAGTPMSPCFTARADAGGIRARALPGTVSGLQSRTASGQDTDRVLQGHQSDRSEFRK